MLEKVLSHIFKLLMRLVRNSQAIKGKLEYNIEIIDFGFCKKLAIILKNENGSLATDLSQEEKLEIIKNHLL